MTVEFQGLGPVQVQASSGAKHAASPDDLAEPGSVALRDSHGRILTRATFETAKVWPNAPRVRSFNVVGLKDPLVAALSREVGGSDHHFELSLLGCAASGCREVLPAHIFASLQDSVCVGPLGPNHTPLVLEVSFVWGQESHYEPHRYRVTEYRWDGTAFQKYQTRESKRAHPSWREAAREFGFTCTHNIVASLSPDLRE
jgi:hypothetical protein